MNRAQKKMFKTLDRMARETAEEFDVPKLLDRCESAVRRRLRREYHLAAPKNGLLEIPSDAPIELRRLEKLLLRSRELRHWLNSSQPDAKRFAVRYALDLGRLALAAGIHLEKLASEARFGWRIRFANKQGRGGPERAAESRREHARLLAEGYTSTVAAELVAKKLRRNIATIYRHLDLKSPAA